MRTHRCDDTYVCVSECMCVCDGGRHKCGVSGFSVVNSEANKCDQSVCPCKEFLLV